MFCLYIIAAVVDVVAVVVVAAVVVVVVAVDATYQWSPALCSKPNQCFETKKEKINIAIFRNKSSRAIIFLF